MLFNCQVLAVPLTAWSRLIGNWRASSAIDSAVGSRQPLRLNSTRLDEWACALLSGVNVRVRTRRSTRSGLTWSKEMYEEKKDGWKITAEQGVAVIHSIIIILWYIYYKYYGWHSVVVDTLQLLEESRAKGAGRDGGGWVGYALINSQIINQW